MVEWMDEWMSFLYDRFLVFRFRFLGVIVCVVFCVVCLFGFLLIDFFVWIGVGVRSDFG